MQNLSVANRQEQRKHFQVECQAHKLDCPTPFRMSDKKDRGRKTFFDLSELEEARNYVRNLTPIDDADTALLTYFLAEAEIKDAFWLNSTGQRCMMLPGKLPK